MLLKVLALRARYFTVVCGNVKKFVNVDRTVAVNEICDNKVDN